MCAHRKCYRNKIPGAKGKVPLRRAYEYSGAVTCLIHRENIVIKSWELNDGCADLIPGGTSVPKGRDAHANFRK